MKRTSTRKLLRAVTCVARNGRIAHPRAQGRGCRGAEAMPNAPLPHLFDDPPIAGFHYPARRKGSSPHRPCRGSFLAEGPKRRASVERRPAAGASAPVAPLRGAPLLHDAGKREITSALADAHLGPSSRHEHHSRSGRLRLSGRIARRLSPPVANVPLEFQPGTRWR